MIAIEERKKLKLLLGSTYSNDIYHFLKKKGIRNRNGEFHNQNYIRKVFQGIRNNDDVESAIWEIAAQKKASNDALVHSKLNTLN